MRTTAIEYSDERRFFSESVHETIKEALMILWNSTIKMNFLKIGFLICSCDYHEYSSFKSTRYKILARNGSISFFFKRHKVEKIRTC